MILRQTLIINFCDEEFDSGSERTLAACLTHASRARKTFGSSIAADGGGTRENLPFSEGYPREIEVNTAYVPSGRKVASCCC